jgi:hypothetical protein
MRHRLAHAPRWVVSTVMGLLFGAFMAVYTVAQRGESAWSVPSLVGGAIAGVFAGAFLGWFMGRFIVEQRDSARAAIGTEVDDELFRRAVRAADKGPVPSDPDVRDAAAAVLAYRLMVTERQQRWSRWLFAALGVYAVVSAVTGSPWWWAGAAVFAGFLVVMIVQPRRMRRRLTLLES